MSPGEVNRVVTDLYTAGGESTVFLLTVGRVVQSHKIPTT